MRELEEERASITIDGEDSLEDYYTLLQQYKDLKNDARSIVLAPKYCLPFLQPGRLVSIQLTNIDEVPSFSIDDQSTWGVIINFERVKGLSEGWRPRSFCVCLMICYVMSNLYYIYH